MGQLLGQLDGLLGDLATHLPSALHPPLIRSLLQALADALVRVLLDGGPFRLFAPDDCGMIEEDLDALAALFHADGEGLPREDVDRILNPLSELLTVLQLETPILIDNFKQARTRGVPTGSGRLLAYDPAVIQHVLAHRPDHAASKFLKKEFRLPKKVGSSSGGSAFTGSFGYGRVQVSPMS
ncbi:hypothetical protein WJX84_001605 [Apatococcus fuscideae]|uniref:MHD2 domain-containing protein n=1 Tax=Apatococcus fuscideae TaxID=2026836 RepID=A0AAW1SSQ3_9CHLO